jgi:hypothetical protein
MPKMIKGVENPCPMVPKDIHFDAKEDDKTH